MKIITEALLFAGLGMLILAGAGFILTLMCIPVVFIWVICEAMIKIFG